jgi:hypothetical protein
MNTTICKMCNKGTIANTKVYRMSTVGVVIGYIFLGLSLLGLLLALISFVGSLKPAQGNFQAVQEFQRDMARLGALFIGFVSFVGGGVGWLLIRKKSVLKCNQCGVEVPASLSRVHDEST